MVWISGDHNVVVHAGLVVDWTHRQFDPAAPVPLIEPMEQYLLRER